MGLLQITKNVSQLIGAVPKVSGVTNSEESKERVARKTRSHFQSSLTSLVLLFFVGNTYAATIQCPNVKADLWFANDESGSVDAQEFRNSLDFLYQISDSFIYDDINGVKAGITGWGNAVNSAEVLMPITQNFGDPGDSGLISTGNITTNGNGTGLRELYNTKKNTSRGTSLGYASQYLAGLINSNTKGRRQGVKQIAVFLTDAVDVQLYSTAYQGGSTWVNAANTLKNAGPDGTSIVLVIIAEAAAAYRNNPVTKNIIDQVVGGGLLVIVDDYADAADPTKGYIDQVVNSVCNVVAFDNSDWGDAPDSYGTDRTEGNSGNDKSGAGHAIVSGLHLGINAPDKEDEGQPSSNADGDGADEDAISQFPPLTTVATTYTIPASSIQVTNTYGEDAKLYGFIDFNKDGDFNDTGESTVVAVPDGATNPASALVFQNFAISNTAGTTYARFRISTEIGLIATSFAKDGEVEDYQLSIIKPDYDYGDAPNDGVDFSYGVAKHIIPANDKLRIGSKKAKKNAESEIENWTNEWTGHANRKDWFKKNKDRRGHGNGYRKKDDPVEILPDVVGDGDEEDGLSTREYTWSNGSSCTGLLPDGTMGTITITENRYCLTVKASNDSTTAAQLVGWIDFNQNGKFDDPQERSVVDVDADTTNDDTQGNVPAGTNEQDVVLYWEGLAKISGDLNTFIRTRLTSDPEFKSNHSPDPIGVAINGEVEDTNIGINVTGTDYGDAPDSYGDASHVIELDAYMGTTIDNDNNSQNAANGSSDGTGDDNDGFDDDDGVASFPILRTDSQSYSVDIVVTSPAATAANLVGWIDFDNSGTFDNDEAATVVVPQNTTETAVTLTWTSLPADAVIASTYARVRLTTDTSIATGTASTSLPTGLADDGEVEDYAINIVRPFSSYVCPSAKADMWFANDESGSVSASEFNNALDFLYHISDEFIYDDVTGVKAGITGWGSNVASAEVLIPISESFGDPGDSGLISTSVVTNNNGTGIRELYDTKKNTSSGTRLDYATTYLAGLINAGNGRRTGIPQIAILLTDASSSQLTNAGSGGGSNWISAANALRAAGPDGTRLVVIITEEAATAYNSGAAKATVDAVVGDGKLLVVPTYVDAADPAKQYINSVVQTVCATIDPKLDYGDAPDTYTDASHDIFYSSDVYLGAIDPDQDTESQNAANAGTDGLGDDNDGVDDEDGLSTLPELTDIDDSYELDVVVTNNRGDTAYLVGWIDINSNGTFESSEAATVAVSNGTNGATVKLNWTNLASSIKAGTSQIRLRLTTDTSVATGDASTSLVGGNATDGEVEDYEFTIVVGGFPVKGRAYLDSSVDGINDGSEVGISNLPIVLLDIINSTCVSTRTNADGDYEFFPVIPGDYQLYEASRETVPTPQNCDALLAKDPANYRSTTNNALAQFSVVDAEITGKDFGDVKGPRFEPDNTGTILAGNVEFYAHKFTAKSTGSVDFTSSNSGGATAGWSSVIYQDVDCNGQLESVEAVAPVAVNLATIAGQDICLINKVYAPTGVSAGETFTNVISANFNFNNNALAGTTILKVTDLTRAAANDPVLGSSKLELRKTVQNITQSSAETATQDQAKPSDVLRYRIYYSNTGSGLITDLKINDIVPAFTTLNGLPTCETPLPESLTSCIGNVSGGDIEWIFGVGDSLKGGAQGMVSYEVTID